MLSRGINSVLERVQRRCVAQQVASFSTGLFLLRRVYGVNLFSTFSQEKETLEGGKNPEIGR